MILENGTVLPHGLIGLQDPSGAASAFNRSYRNTGLKAGFIIRSYIPTDPKNVSKFNIEYDVQVMEQMENQGSTSILYRNCIAVQGFGGIGDFIESTYRTQSYQPKNAPTFANQDGSIVLLQCLDNIGTKAIIVGSLGHPNRPTTIANDEPQLQGEYNGVNVKINTDGSTSLTFKGATDANGKIIDSSQGPTVFQIKTDGSFEFNHSTVDILADKSGALTITTKANCNITAEGDIVAQCVNANITSSGKANITAKGDATLEGQAVNLGMNASQSVILGDMFKKVFDAHLHPTPVGPSGPPSTPMPQNTLSRKVKTE